MRKESIAKEDSTLGIVPSAPWRLREVSALEDYCLHVEFLDGTEGTVDLSNLVKSKEAGVFKALEDPALFNQVYLDHGAVTWPGEIDLAPDAMYEAIKNHGEWVLE